MSSLVSPRLIRLGRKIARQRAVGNAEVRTHPFKKIPSRNGITGFIKDF